MDELPGTTGIQQMLVRHSRVRLFASELKGAFVLGGCDLRGERHVGARDATVGIRVGNGVLADAHCPRLARMTACSVAATRFLHCSLVSRWGAGFCSVTIFRKLP
ncbi:hypothetical protein D3C73_1041780 [compost metagenome]